MADDLNRKLQTQLEELAQRIQALERWNPLEAASVTAGRLRIIGGTLRVDSGGNVEIVGEWRFIGPGAITGDVVAEGKWTQNGLWEFNGDGDIAGDVDLTGDMRVLGNIQVLPGGKIQVGNIVIDPTISGGAVAFANGAQVFTDGTTIQVYKGNSVVQVADAYARLQHGGSVVSIGSDGIKMSGMESRSSASTGLPAGVLGIDGQTVFRVA